ncbi:MFS transporter [Emticicia aquatilis]|uniref:MFS transporter n=1 Tax=Emticicia aquatilis TaxID=1537369 RepID=A0A917DWN3_9BACT|nr:MFS transporter [Emticicia aquatilis]GGD75873.1 MFS transporter [Emticicia aquatilis]
MSKNYKWWVVFMLWFVCFFNYADRQAIFSVFPLLKQEMGLSDVQLGIVGAAFMWVYAGFGAIAGIVGDKFQRKTLIIGGLIFWSLVTIGTALSTNYVHLVICRALEGFGEAFYFPASMSLLSDYHSKETRSKAMSFHQSSVYAGTIAGGTVAGFMGQYYGWHTSFYLFGGLGVLLGVVLLGFLKEPVRGQAEIHDEIEDNSHVLLDLKQGNIFDNIKQVFSQPMVWILVAVFVGANFVASIFLTWMPSFLYNKFNMSLSMAGLNATFYLQMASVLGVISGGFLADKLVKSYRGGRMMTQSIGLLMGVPFIFLAGWTLSIPILILALIGFGYFKGLYDANIWASLHDVVKPKNRATAVGFMNSIGWFGGGIAPIAIAYASTKYGMSASISATSALYLVFGLLLIFGIRKFMQKPKS